MGDRFRRFFILVCLLFLFMRSVQGAIVGALVIGGSHWVGHEVFGSSESFVAAGVVGAGVVVVVVSFFWLKFRG